MFNSKFENVIEMKALHIFTIVDECDKNDKYFFLLKKKY